MTTKPNTRYGVFKGTDGKTYLVDSLNFITFLPGRLFRFKRAKGIPLDDNKFEVVKMNPNPNPKSSTGSKWFGGFLLASTFNFFIDNTPTIKFDFQLQLTWLIIQFFLYVCLFVYMYMQKTRLPDELLNIKPVHFTVSYAESKATPKVVWGIIFPWYVIIGLFGWFYYHTLLVVKQDTIGGLLFAAIALMVAMFFMIWPYNSAPRVLIVERNRENIES